MLYRLARENRRFSVQRLRRAWQPNVNFAVSRQTVNRRLVVRAYRARQMVKVPRLTESAKLVRRHWAQKHINRPLGKWQHVIFCDEIRFMLFRIYNRIRVRRLVGEVMNEDCTHGNVAHGGGSLHIWGGISHMGKTSLCVLDQMSLEPFIAEVLEDHLVPHDRTWYRNNWLLADDNARPHRDCVVDEPPWTRRNPRGLGPLLSGYELNRTYLGRNWWWFGGIGPSVSEPEGNWELLSKLYGNISRWKEFRPWLVACHAESVL